MDAKAGSLDLQTMCRCYAMVMAPGLGGLTCVCGHVGAVEAGLLAGGAEGGRGVRHAQLAQQQRGVPEPAPRRHDAQRAPHIALVLQACSRT